MNPRNLALAGTLCLAAATWAAPAHAVDVETDGTHNHMVGVHVPLVDLQPDVANPTDGASARFVTYTMHGQTAYFLRLTGLDATKAGTVYGIHAHVGECVAGDGKAAGPHYNHDKATGATDPVISAQTEVWLDSTVGKDGRSLAMTQVPFVAEPGAIKSVVIHELPTNPDTGMAGGRQACLPVPQ